MTDLVALHEIENENDSFIKAIVETKGANLPASIEDVKGIFEFTDFKAKAWKILVSKMSSLEEHSEAYQSAIRSGQHWGIAALYAQKRMGEITRDMPKEKPYPGSAGTTSGKQTRLSQTGISKQNASESERIAAHPEILDRVIESAKERGEIPTKTAVLNTIRVENAKAREAVQREKSNDKLDNQRSQAVADYYEAVKGFNAALQFAIIAAERGKFDPAGKNFMVKKHKEISTLIAKLEALV